MPSASDFFAELQGANARLDQIKTSVLSVKTSVDAVKTSTDAVHTAVQQVNTTLSTGFGQLVTLGVYTNEALAHNAKQNDTIICILEHIEEHTCALVNYADEQTRLQRSMEANTRMLAELYAATHAEAALERQEHEELQKKIERCCPPPKPEPPCRPERCPKPPPLREPPHVEAPGAQTPRRSDGDRPRRTRAPR